MPRSSSNSPVRCKQVHEIAAVVDGFADQVRFSGSQVVLRGKHEKYRGRAELIALLIGIHALLRQVARYFGQLDACLAVIHLADRLQHLQPDILNRAFRPQRIQFLVDHRVGEIGGCVPILDR